MECGISLRTATFIDIIYIGRDRYPCRNDRKQYSSIVSQGQRPILVSQGQRPNRVGREQYPS